ICRQRNHKAPKSGIPKRKKTETRPRLSCKIEYLLRSNHCDVSIASEFFTADYRTYWARFLNQCCSWTPSKNLFQQTARSNLKFCKGGWTLGKRTRPTTSCM